MRLTEEIFSSSIIYKIEVGSKLDKKVDALSMISIG